MEHGTGAPIGFSKFIDMMNQEQAKDLVRKINTYVQCVLDYPQMLASGSLANCHNRCCRFMRDFKQRPNDPEQDSRHVQVLNKTYAPLA